VTAEAVPAWLAAWRERGPQPPAQPRQHPGQGCTGGAVRNAAVAEAARPARPKANWHGFVEPAQWPDDGGLRREAVLDMDHNPPRVVRHVGWQRCITCRSPFFSEDVLALRLCDGPEGCQGEARIEYRRKAAVLKETDDT